MARNRTRMSISMNGEEPIDVTDAMHNISVGRFIDRLENLETEKRAVQEQIKEVMKEVEGAGFNKAAVRTLVKRRFESTEQRTARLDAEQALELMIAALGEFGNTPLGENAIERTRTDA